MRCSMSLRTTCHHANLHALRHRLLENDEFVRKIVEVRENDEFVLEDVEVRVHHAEHCLTDNCSVTELGGVLHVREIPLPLFAPASIGRAQKQNTKRKHRKGII